MAYGMSFEKALELVKESAKQEYCWAIKQLKKLFKK